MTSSPTPSSSNNSTPTPGPSTETNKRHATTAVDRQRFALNRLLKDPAKPAYIPPPPAEKAIRPAREMMKNVQGSSAGAGSGEFHVYKASRRREYERLKIMEEEQRKEAEVADFEKKRKEAEEVANKKTDKNRAKRQKRKERAKNKGGSTVKEGDDSAPLKKRRMVNGKELVFRKPGEESEDDEDNEAEHGPAPAMSEPTPIVEDAPTASVQPNNIIIHEDD